MSEISIGRDEIRTRRGLGCFPGTVIDVSAQDGQPALRTERGSELCCRYTRHCRPAAHSTKIKVIATQKGCPNSHSIATTAAHLSDARYALGFSVLGLHQRVWLNEHDIRIPNFIERETYSDKHIYIDQQSSVTSGHLLSSSSD